MSVNPSVGLRCPACSTKVVVQMGGFPGSEYHQQHAVPAHMVPELTTAQIYCHGCRSHLKVAPREIVTVEVEVKTT